MKTKVIHRNMNRNNGRLCRWVLSLGLFLSLLAVIDLDTAFSEDHPVKNFTGAHTRVVWVQDQGDGADTFANSKNMRLVGYDSHDSKGERYLLKEKGSYFKPLLTPDGSQVVVTDRVRKKIYLVDWNDGSKKSLGNGQALEVWQDPADDTVWVYCLDGRGGENFYLSKKSLYRFPLNKPKKRELVWKKTGLSWSNFQLSRDGSIAGGLFPWPHGGILYPKEGRWQRFGRGCWTSLSPDDRGLLWIFDGLHRNLTIFETDTGENWKVNINNAPEMEGYEVYHPRWTSHPEYLVVTGPYKEGEGGNKIRGGGKKVEIFLGQFDDTLQSVQKWMQVSQNTKGDFYPDAWIEHTNDVADAAAGNEPSAETADSDGQWPLSRKNLVFVWENLKGSNQLEEDSPVGFMQVNVKARGEALFGRRLDMNVRGGWFETGAAGEKIGKAVKKSNQLSMEMVVSPQDGADGAGVVADFSGKSGSVVRVQQEKSDLVLTVQSAAGKERKSFRWPNTFQGITSSHLTLNWGKDITLFVNGKSRGSQAVDGLKLSDLHLDTLAFGSPDAPWRGNIESVALYNQVIGEEIARQSYSNLSRGWAKRNLVPKVVVSATPLEQTGIPAPGDLGAYSRAMVVNVYQVDKVLEGAYEQDRIVVAEWAILDRQDVISREPSPESRTLVLEKFDDHPELEGERLFMDIFEPDLDTYYLDPDSAHMP